MIKSKKISHLSPEDLLYYTSDGKEIYEHYLGRVSRVAMKCPWRSDKHPSWGIFYKGGTWLWKDQATEEAGNAITFVQRLFDLSYSDAMQKIAFDFKLGDKQVIADRVYEKQAEKPKDYVKIEYLITPFKKRHHEFWNCVEVTEDVCKKFDCYAVKDLSINGLNIQLSPVERVFVYYAQDIMANKIYFPDRVGNNRFRTNVPYNYLWEYSKLGNCDKLVVHKSMKDLIVFSQLFPCNIATQNESVKIFNEEVVGKINSITTEPWIFYGSDNDGVKKCTEITNTNKWKYINTPKSMLPEINDVYSYVKKHGLKSLETFCKSKKLI